MGLSCAAPPTEWALVVDPVVSCPSPAAAPHFTEAGEALGLSGPVDEGASVDGGGIAVLDLNRDGLLDLAVTYGRAHLEVWWGGPQGFTREAHDLGLTWLLSPADVNGDGWPELVTTGAGPRLIENDGGTLRARRRALAPIHGGVTRELAPLDLDGDGDLDLFAVNTAQDVDDMRDALLINDGDGGFSLVWLDGARAARQGFDAVVADLDQDGLDDVYVVNDQGQDFGPNALWMNRRGTLGAPEVDCFCEPVMQGMGGSAADRDQDGDLDLYLTGVGHNLLLDGVADGFVDSGAATGADPLPGGEEMAWGAGWADLDNDGRADLAIAQGDFGPPHEVLGGAPRPLTLLMQQEDGRFEARGPELGVDALGTFRAVVHADLNGDGALDLVLTSLDARPQVFLSEGCLAGAWLAVEASEGARVQVGVDGAVRRAEIRSQQGYGGAGPTEAWFGLGDVDEVDFIEITENNGASWRVEGPLEARRRVRVVPLPQGEDTSPQ